MLSEMEESPPLSLSCSSWRLKQQSLRSQRNFRQLQNRLVVLQLEREGKVKQIQHKLQQHRKHMQTRLHRKQLDSIIGESSKQKREQSQHNSRVFREGRMKRAFNIRNQSCRIRQQNSAMFQEVRQQRINNQRIIQEEKEQELRKKAQKRNKVRMIEIEAKENVQRYWQGRIEGFKHERERDVEMRMAAQEQQMQELVTLEKTQEKLLGEIKKAQEMESHLQKMMAQEKEVLYKHTQQ